MTGSTRDAPQAPAGLGVQPPNPGLERTLKIVVAILGLLILAGLGAVFARMAYLASGRGSQAALTAADGDVAASGAAGAARRALVPEAALDLPDGASVRSVSLSGGRLAVQYDAPGGGGIAIVDLETGETISRVRIPGPPAR